MEIFNVALLLVLAIKKIPVMEYHISPISKLSRAILTMANTLNTASKYYNAFAGDNRAAIR